MERYYIAAWIFGLFFVGTGCLIMDMVYAKEEPETIISNPTPKIALGSMYQSDDSFIDDVQENHTDTDYLKESEEKYFDL